MKTAQSFIIRRIRNKGSKPSGFLGADGIFWQTKYMAPLLEMTTETEADNKIESLYAKYGNEEYSFIKVRH